MVGGDKNSDYNY